MVEENGGRGWREGRAEREEGWDKDRESRKVRRIGGGMERIVESWEGKVKRGESRRDKGREDGKLLDQGGSRWIKGRGCGELSAR
jgi:hypothetical protein